MASGIFLSAAGRTWRRFGRGWPDTMAVVGFAFLRINQDLVGVIDLTLIGFVVHRMEQRRHSPDETSPLLESCPRLEHDRDVFEVPVSCMLFGLEIRL
jgi:hypothetical protein